MAAGSGGAPSDISLVLILSWIDGFVRPCGGKNENRKRGFGNDPLGNRSPSFRDLELGRGDPSRLVGLGLKKNLSEAEYEVTWQDQTALPDVPAAWQAPNRTQGFRTYFTDSGIRLLPRTEESPSWTWGLSLLGFGPGPHLWSVNQPVLHPSKNRIDFARGGIGEWYENSPKGLEQGFKLLSPPEEMGRKPGSPGEDTMAPRGPQDRPTAPAAQRPIPSVR